VFFVKALIIGGFLGSGKTSFMLQLLDYIIGVSKSDKKYQVVVLENEIGDVGVDDKTLKAGGFLVETMFAGCACCTSSESVPAALTNIQKAVDPDWVVLEATGVAYPRKIRETITANTDFESRISTVVDAKRWKRLLLPMAMLIGGQLEQAETIIVNKKDLVDSGSLEETLKSVGSYNGAAKLIPVSSIEKIDSGVFKTVLGMA
jgi:G3E family GTPase